MLSPAYRRSRRSSELRSMSMFAPRIGPSASATTHCMTELAAYGGRPRRALTGCWGRWLLLLVLRWLDCAPSRPKRTATVENRTTAFTSSYQDNVWMFDAVAPTYSMPGGFTVCTWFKVDTLADQDTGKPNYPINPLIDGDRYGIYIDSGEYLGPCSVFEYVAGC